MKKYFFGYLFVKLAKLLAILALLAGLGYCLWKYGQAHLAADGVAYRPSDSLSAQLGRLSHEAQSARKLVTQFAGTDPLGQAKDVAFTTYLSSDSDFELLKRQLGNLESERQQLKEAVTHRFEAMVTEIEAKLQARANALAAANATAPSSSATPFAAPSAPPAPAPLATERETLYVIGLLGSEIERRIALLGRTKQLLITIETAADNPQNRQTLADAQAQLDHLETLLPPTPEPVQSVPASPPEPANNLSTPTPPPKVFNAEKVANQLRATRFQVREAILSSWELDGAFDQASATASVESTKCRVSSIAVKGIWLAYFGQIGLAVLVTIVVAFLILVFADLTQTLLDTATNTGITAEATKETKGQ